MIIIDVKDLFFIPSALSSINLFYLLRIFLHTSISTISQQSNNFSDSKRPNQPTKTFNKIKAFIHSHGMNLFSVSK